MACPLSDELDVDQLHRDVYCALKRIVGCQHSLMEKFEQLPSSCPLIAKVLRRWSEDADGLCWAAHIMQDEAGVHVEQHAKKVLSFSKATPPRGR